MAQNPLHGQRHQVFDVFQRGFPIPVVWRRVTGLGIKDGFSHAWFN